MKKSPVGKLKNRLRCALAVKPTADSRPGSINTLQDEPYTFLRIDRTILDWDYFLINSNNWIHIPPMSSDCFPHEPLAGKWETFTSFSVGKYVEIPNDHLPISKGEEKVYWIAKIIAFAGYKCLVEFERFELAEKMRHFAWISFFSPVPKVLGWARKKKQLLFPDLEVNQVIPNWVEKLELLDKKNALSTKHNIFLKKNLEEGNNHIVFPNGQKLKVELGLRLEVLNCENALYKMRVGVVKGIIGDRIHVEYEDIFEIRRKWFSFSIHSELIHMIGWSLAVGQNLFNDSKKIPPDSNLPINLYDPNFHPKVPEEFKIEVHDFLECVHPLFTSKIYSAKVIKVLKFGYFQVKIESCKDQCPIVYTFHATSPMIFACGWAQANDIKIYPPVETKNFEGLEKNFNWKIFFEKAYSKIANYKAAPLHLIEHKSKNHNFKLGMKVEAFESIQPSYCGPATIIRIADNLLLLHFDGWSFKSENTQWVDAYSPDIHPLGWAEMVGYKLQSSPTFPVSDILANTIHISK